ncbi:hypothetical protein AN232_19855 [Citrobacter sp. CRE-46]|nr:hypothetical protein AN232_19855 [Citrobacter sp. CRE-46]
MIKSVWKYRGQSSKHEKELISRTVQEMFEEADMWLVQD